MKFILKDGTEFTISSLIYRHVPNSTYDQDYTVRVVSENPQEDIERAASMLTEDNISAVTVTVNDQTSFNFSFKRVSMINVDISETHTGCMDFMIAFQ